MPARVAVGRLLLFRTEQNRTKKETEQLIVTVAQWGVLKSTQEKSFLLSMLVLPWNRLSPSDRGN